MKNLKLSITVILLLCLNCLYAQTPPNLHVEGNVSTTNVFTENFEGTMGSFTTGTGSASGWTFTSTDSYISSSSAFTSFADAGSSTLENTLIVPPGSTGEFSFYYKCVSTGSGTFAYVTDPASYFSYDGLIVDGNWHYHTILIPEGTFNLNILLTHYYSYGYNSTLYIDYARFNLTSNYAVKITDGNEGLGKVLTSDGAGNATWYDINDAISDFEIFDPLIISDATNDAISINGSGDDGIFIGDSADEGIYIDDSGDYGIYIRDSGDDGIFSTSNDDYAGYFSGDLYGTVLSKSSGTFIIDHPLDPENKFMYHSFVESPDMMNIYNGNVLLDANGEAEVQMEEWFDALNADFRYQLTAIGAPGPNLYIAEKMNNNTFKIAGGTSGMEVSWTVTGIRIDPHAEANRVEVEVDKPEEYIGFYLDADAYGLPFERSIDYVKTKDQDNDSNETEAIKRETQFTVPGSQVAPLIPTNGTPNKQ